MLKYFTKTNIGYSHILNKKPCQDFSISYHDEERTIISVCDGHGGNSYIRSNRGSKFACRALLNTFLSIQKKHLKNTNEEILKFIKINILTEWNRLVEEDLKKSPFKKLEFKSLSLEEKNKIKQNPVKAYGTTLIGAMLFSGKFICIQLGDGGSFILNKGDIRLAIEDKDDTVANITYSLCGDHVYEHMRGAIYSEKDIEGIFICTDGVLNPYQNYQNFYEFFLKPSIRDIYKEGVNNTIVSFIKDLGLTKGNGDDVSLGFLLKEKINLKKYK